MIETTRTEPVDEEQLGTKRITAKSWPSAYMRRCQTRAGRKVTCPGQLVSDA